MHDLHITALHLNSHRNPVYPFLHIERLKCGKAQWLTSERILKKRLARGLWPYLPGFTVLCLPWDLSSIPTERYFNLKKRKVKKKERKKEGGL